MPPPTQAEIDAGQAPYRKWFLWIYDYLILGIYCRFLWKCPSHHLLDNYNANISANHLDVGVGTGYFLDHCRFPSDTPRVALLDLNANCLEVTGRRLARYRPETFQGNAYQPFDVGATAYDSVAINGLIHCLPGTMEEKGVVFDHVRQVLNPNGIVFGCTILGKGVDKGWAARVMMQGANRSRAFCNLEDGREGLERQLSARFDDIRLDVIGCMALFSARKQGGAAAAG